MANINQQPTALALTGVIGSPFSLLVNFTSITNSGASVAWSNVTNPQVVIADTYGNAIPSSLPVITSPNAFQLNLAWSATQTSLISNAQNPRWALQTTIFGTGPETLISGPLLFTPPGYPASSTSNSANLAVTVGTANVSLAVTLGGASGITDLTSQDNSVVIVSATGPITDVSVLPIVHAASVNAVAVSEAYADTSAHAASVAAVTTSEAYALGQAASVKSLALLQANNLSDVQDAGTSRSNVHIPILAACQTVATASVSTSAPTNGPWNGASVNVGNQILLTAQTPGSQNGPWVYNGPSSSLTRPTDYATGASVLSRVVQITAGTYANNEWMMDNQSVAIVDTTSTTWTQGYSGTYVPEGAGTFATDDVAFKSGRPWIDITAYGAVADGDQIFDGVMSSVTTPTVLTSASNLFTSAMVGKPIDVVGAGAAGVVLATTVASFQSAGSITLASPALTTVSAAWAGWGTDNATAIQAAITAAGATFAVHISPPPPGLAYYCRSGLVGHLFTQMNGDTFDLAIGPHGGTRLLFSPNVAIGYTDGGNNVIRRFIIDGGSTTIGNVGLSATNHVQREQIQIYRWDTGEALNGADYYGSIECEWAYNNVHIATTTCLNFSLYRPTMRATGIGIKTANGIRGLNIFGGSIEGLVGGGAPTPVAGILVDATTPSVVNLFGTYFEMKGGRSIDARSGIAGTIINLYGTRQFVENLTAAVDISSGAATLGGGGNIFSAPVSSGTPVCYALSGNTGGSGLPAGDSIAQLLSGTYTDTLGFLPGLKASGITYHVGRYYGLRHGVGASFVPVSNDLYFAPFLVDKTHTWVGITVPISSAGGTGSVVRLGIYADDGTGNPGTLILDAGTIDGTLTTVQTKVISQTLPPGLYWLACCGQGSPTPQPTLRGATGFSDQGIINPNNYYCPGYLQTGVAGALPTAGVTADAATVPGVYLQA